MVDTGRIKLFAGIFGIIIIAVVLFVVFKPKMRTIPTYPVSASFASAIAYGNNAVVFSNGQRLETYNYATGQTKALSPDNLGLDSIDTVSVSPDDNYILFHDETLDPGGGLAAQLQAQGLDPSLDYWWLYNVAKQTFSSLPQGLLLAKLNGTTVYAIGGSASGEVLNSYSISNLQQVNTMSIPGSSTFFVTPSGFLLESPDNNVLFTKDGVVNTVLFKSTVLVGTTSDGSSALAVMTQNGVRKLISINLSTNTTKTIASNVVDLPVWLGSGMALYLGSDQQIYYYDFATQKNSLWQPAVRTNIVKSKSLSLVGLVGPYAAIVNNSSGYYLIGNNLAPVGSIQ